MAETYSLASVSIPSDSLPQAVASLDTPDSAARPGSQSMLMRTGGQVLCRKPDNSTAWFTIDAERSRPGGPIVMKAVGP